MNKQLLFNNALCLSCQQVEVERSVEWLGYGLDSPGFESRHGQEISLFFQIVNWSYASAPSIRFYVVNSEHWTLYLIWRWLIVLWKWTAEYLQFRVVCHTCENVKHAVYILISSIESYFHIWRYLQRTPTFLLCFEELKGIAGRNSSNVTSICNMTAVQLVRSAVTGGGYNHTGQQYSWFAVLLPREAITILDSSTVGSQCCYRGRL